MRSSKNVTALLEQGYRSFLNLLYTGVTRARKCVTVVGSEETFGEMIRNEKQQKRYSSLGTRIQELSGSVVSKTMSSVSQDSQKQS